MSAEDKILALIKTKGPVLPVDIAKVLGTSILLASAHLSDLRSRDKVKISHTKIGGSPVYYIKGQEYKLQDLANNLNNKELKVYDNIKDKKILRDIDLAPSERVMIRNIKDFAFPFYVNFGEKREMFWKWYLLSDEEVHKEIETKFTKKEETAKDEQKAPEEEKTKQEEIKKIDEIPLEENRKKLDQEKTDIQKSLEFEKIRKEKPKPKEENLEQEEPPEQTDDFFNIVNEFFIKNKIIILENQILKKGKDIEYKLIVPSAVGEMEYSCFAKNKKRINEGDLSSAFIQGQLRRLPVLFLTTGELTKKAKEMLEKELKGIVVKRI